MAKQKIYVTRKWKAVQDDGTILWPERFSLQWLANKRAQMGGYAFSSEYLNEPIDVEARKFRPEWVQWYTSADLIYNEAERCLYFKDTPIRQYLGMDQAIAEKEDKAVDESAATVVGATADARVLILYVWHDRVDFPKQVQMVRSISKDWSVTLTGIEKQAYQAALAQQIIHEAWLPIRLLDNTRPKYERITAMSIPFEQSRVYMRACTPDEPGSMYDELGNVRVHPSMEALYEQLMQFPMAPHDDILDSLYNALNVAGHHRGFQGFF